MKSINWLAIGALVLGLIAVPDQSFAQKKKGKKKKTTAAAPTAPAAAVDTTPKVVINAYDPPNLDSAGYNALSVRPIHVSDIMYKMTIWRRIDMREKCNEPFFPAGNEISKLMIQGVLDGKLKAYTTDSVNRLMTKEQFIAKIKDPSAGEVPAASSGGDSWGDAAPAGGAGAAPAAPSGPILLQPFQLYLFDMKEDLIFDKQRSQMKNDIQSLTMVIDSKFSVKAIEEYVATFRYKDLVKYFASIPTAKWFNFQNRAEDKKISDAMDLRLFCSRITKISNPKDNSIAQIDTYNKSDKMVLITSQQFEYDLVEKENELWDF